MSDTLWAFAAPLLQELPEDAPIAEIEISLRLAQFAWNVASAPDYAVLIERCAQAVPMAPTAPRSARDILYDLVQRKRERFADDGRTIIDFQISRDSEGIRVLAASAYHSA